jgi:hypothetical protein
LNIIDLIDFLKKSIISAGYGMGSFTFSWVTFWLANPNNQSVDEHGYMPASVCDNWPRNYYYNLK